MLREKVVNFTLFFYLFKNSLILIFVFPLIQIWKISRDNIFFYRLSICLREPGRGNASKKRKIQRSFCEYELCSLFMGQPFYHHCYLVGISQLNHVATTRATDEVGRNGGGTSV